MSTFRPPFGDRAPGAKLSLDPESNPSTDPHRQGAFKALTSSGDDIAPMFSRFDRGPVSQRSSALAASLNSTSRPTIPATVGSASAISHGSNKGGICEITRMLEKKHGAFFISRIILASGINLRSYNSTSIDDPATMSKFIRTLRNLLSPTDMADVFSQVPSFMTTK